MLLGGTSHDISWSSSLHKRLIQHGRSGDIVLSTFRDLKGRFCAYGPIFNLGLEKLMLAIDARLVITANVTDDRLDTTHAAHVRYLPVPV